MASVDAGDDEDLGAMRSGCTEPCEPIEYPEERPTYGMGGALTVTEFVLARIAEDEWAAREAKAYGGTLEELAGWVEIGSDRVDKAEAHFARHDPARVLAQCAAMRKIVERFTEAHEQLRLGTEYGLTFRYGLGVAVEALASIWSDHTDWREEWA
jgi:hypothetical protein